MNLTISGKFGQLVAVVCENTFKGTFSLVIKNLMKMGYNVLI